MTQASVMASCTARRAPARDPDPRAQPSDTFGDGCVLIKSNRGRRFIFAFRLKSLKAMKGEEGVHAPR